MRYLCQSAALSLICSMFVVPAFASETIVECGEGQFYRLQDGWLTEDRVHWQISAAGWRPWCVGDGSTLTIEDGAATCSHLSVSSEIKSHDDLNAYLGEHYRYKHAEAMRLVEEVNAGLWPITVTSTWRERVDFRTLMKYRESGSDFKSPNGRKHNESDLISYPCKLIS